MSDVGSVKLILRQAEEDMVRLQSQAGTIERELGEIRHRLNVVLTGTAATVRGAIDPVDHARNATHVIQRSMIQAQQVISEYRVRLG